MTGGGADRGTNNVANAVSLAFHHHRSKRRKGHLEITMAGILIGYAVAIAIVFFASRPFSINQLRRRAWFRRRVAQLIGQSANGVENAKS